MEMRVSGLRKGGEEVSKALMQRQLNQLKERISRLDAMIQQAKTPKEDRRFRTWKRQLISTLEKGGISMTKAEMKIGFKVTPAHRTKVKAYIKAQPEGKRGPWPEFAKAVGVSGTNLGAVVRDMLKAGTISEPAGKGSMIYVVVPVKGRAAAKKLYIQQRKADDSPKADIVPASKLEEKRAARTRRSTKAA